MKPSDQNTRGQSDHSSDDYQELEREKNSSTTTYTELTNSAVKQDPRSQNNEANTNHPNQATIHVVVNRVSNDNENIDEHEYACVEDEDETVVYEVADTEYSDPTSDTAYYSVPDCSEQSQEDDGYMKPTCI